MNIEQPPDYALFGDMRVGFLPNDIHEVVIKNTVISTVDLIVVKPNNTFLLIMRIGNRWPDVRWFLGGMQKRGHTTLDTILHIAKREIGLEQSDLLKIEHSHTQDVFNPPSLPSVKESFPEQHTKMDVHRVYVREDFTPILDNTSSDPKWYDRKMPHSEVPPPVLCALKQANLID